MITESHRCAICAAEFGSSKDLVHHERTEHTTHAATPTDSTPAGRAGSGEHNRQNREFSRRNTE